MTWTNKKAFEKRVTQRFYSCEKRVVREKDGTILTKYMFNEKHVASWIDGNGGWFE
jgi:hypothetical protein